MRRLGLSTPELDFIVIGAQKAGTTSLWRYLEDNPGLRMPPGKEASFFSEPAYPKQLRSYMRALFKDAPRRARLGTVTPIYMLGTPSVSVAQIAERIRRAAPSVRLVAVLRDPVERAFSAHRMAVRRSGEQRSFRHAVADLLTPSELERARRGPDALNSYVVGGEYGRMLEAYLERFERDQVHIELSADLESVPGQVVGRVCEFVGVEPHQPQHLGRRFYPSGEPLVSPEAENDLKRYLERNVWPRLGHSAQHREAFEFWLRLWNVTSPVPPPGPIDTDVAERLREHYADDMTRLEEATGISVPRR